MNSRPLVSIIVPVYNVERYLEDCIRSIMAQSYDAIELILVDDGSTDASGSICDAFSKMDNRIRVLHNANEGPSCARNRGLSVQKGDYVAFVDADDVVSPFYIETLLKALFTTGARVASLLGVTSIKENGKARLINNIRAVQSLGIEVVNAYDAERLLLYQTTEAGMPLRLYDQSLFGQSPFSPDLIIGEDLIVNYRIFHNVEKIALVKSCELYAYRQLASSLVHRGCSHEKAFSAVRVSDLLYDEIVQWYPELRNAAASRSFSICRSVFAQLPAGACVDVEVARDRLELWNTIKRHRLTVLRDCQARKRERIAAGIACGGQAIFTAFCFFARKIGLMR